MIIVDSHCHVYDTWYESIDTLQVAMDRTGTTQAVLTQFSGNVRNEYLVTAVRKHPDVLAAVAWLDWAQPDAPERLADLANNGIAGIRLRPPAAGSEPGPAWRAAAGLGMTVSTLGSSADFAHPGFADLVHSQPDLQIVIEHLGERRKAGLSYPIESARQVFALARYENVHMKFHGLGEFCPRSRPAGGDDPFERPVPPHLAEAFAAFGPHRMVWGSDWPTVSAREGYANSLKYPMQELQELGATAEELGLMFGGNARRLFSLPEVADVSRAA